MVEIIEKYIVNSRSDTLIASGISPNEETVTIDSVYLILFDTLYLVWKKNDKV